MIKSHISSNGVPQGNAAHSTSEIANNNINTNLYAEIRYVNSKGKRISKIVNIFDNGMDACNRLKRTMGGLNNLNQSSKTSVIVSFYNQGEEVGFVVSRKDEYEKGKINYWLHLSKPDKDIFVGRFDCPFNAWGILSTLVQNQIHPSVEREDGWYKKHVDKLMDNRAQAEEIVKQWDDFDKATLNDMEKKDIHDMIEELSSAIIFLETWSEMDSYKLRKLLYDILSHSFADYSDMIEWLGENGEMSIGVECENYLVEDLMITVDFCGSLGDVLDDVSFYAENVEPLSYMSIDIIGAIKDCLEVHDENENDIA